MSESPTFKTIFQLSKAKLILQEENKNLKATIEELKGKFPEVKEYLENKENEYSVKIGG